MATPGLSILTQKDENFKCIRKCLSVFERAFFSPLVHHSLEFSYGDNAEIRYWTIKQIDTTVYKS